ncbi:MAG: carboxypeptidase regulatory-like domain-containing protein [Vicinamibacterales bacterium]
MSLRVSVWRVLLLAVALAGLASPLAYAQGGGTTASLSGLVVDSSGGVIPGADVVVKNNATNAESRAVTDATGRFEVPALNPGTYTVTVSLMGFKTWSAPDVQLLAATPASVKAVLEVGALEETVIVEGATEIVQTQTASVQTTIAVKQIESLPLVTRTALDYVVALPGAQTPGTGSSRNTEINGLPRSTINITLDGVNVQDNSNKGDGFFMYIRPQLDSVEEITVSASTPGAESSGQGASQIRMVTRSGSNTFAGSVYNSWRNQAGVSEDDVMTRSKKSKWIWRLNTPYWFNKRDLPKTAAGEYFIDDVRLQMPGFRVGGPAVRDKLFYFFNWEWFLWPTQANRTRYVLNPQAQLGLFTYPATSGGTRTVDLMAIARANGQLDSFDPTIARLLGDIAAATKTEGALERYDENVDKYTWSPASDNKRHFPTVRIDANVTPNHRITFTSRYNRFDATPDLLNSVEPRFPGFPNWGGQYSDRFSAQGTLRSTFGRNIVNEARVGWAGGFGKGTLWYPEVKPDSFNCTGPGCQVVGGQGYSLGISAAASGITNATTTTGQSARNTPSIVYEDTLTWLKGQHTISTGASFTMIQGSNWADTAVPVINFGLNSQDPAYAMLDAASGNFPGGISTTYAGYARNLYAVLTGRITQIQATAYQDNGRYTLLGERTQTAYQNELGLFISDSWRAKPNLTLTGGLRYELQFPFTSNTISYARLEDWRMLYGISGETGLFKPGTLAGKSPMLRQYKKGEKAYEMDIDNIAPSFGATWRPNLGSGVLSKILSSDPVFRGGYSISYSRLGTNLLTGTYGTNPGLSRSATRSITAGEPKIGYDGLPVLLRQPSRVFPGAFPETPTYPFAPAVNEDIDELNPNFFTPYTHQWSFGWQRELGKSMAMEVRYVGNTNVGDWMTWDINDTSNWNFLENGFYDEFRTAQQNLLANVKNGRGPRFDYTGAPGTAPLPIFMAYFAGIPLNDARNKDPQQYAAISQFRNSSWYNQVRMYSPNMTGIAGTGTNGLQNSAYAANAAKAGLPLNFFIPNPDSAQANSYLDTNGGNTKYHALQFELRRRMTGGLLVQGSYNLQLSRKGYSWTSLRDDWQYVDSTGGPVHGFKVNWVFELPFGRGRRFASGASRWLDMIIGGWEWDGQGRFQSGTRFNFGGFRLVGMTEKDLQAMFKIRKEVDSAGKTRVYMLPRDVIEQSIIALTKADATTVTGWSGEAPTGRYLAPASGQDCVQYLDGQCPGTALSRIITGPWYNKWDFAFVKRIAIKGSMRIEARMDLYNVFDAINFIAVGVPSTRTSMSNWEVSSAARDLNASQDAGGRITSFGLRFTW